MTARSLSIALLVALSLLRVPAIAQPMAADQGLYAYAGQQLMAGHAPYAAAWDQKPPGIHVVYGLLWTVWPHESIVATADLLAAILVAVLLVGIGRRRFTEGIGVGAAAVFLLFGNPSLVQRLSGAFVRGQCETFIALTATAAVALLSVHRRKAWHLVATGVLLGCGFWLKYNAAAYALAVMAAIVVWRDGGTSARRASLRELYWIGGAGALSVAVPLAAMTAAGALRDLYLATITYNVSYSGETFQGVSPLRYLFTFPIERARNDALWMLGGAGAILAAVHWLRAPRSMTARSSLVAIAWVAAACLSILVNGARDLPQYFVQAAPALALAAAAGLAPLVGNRTTRGIVPVLTLLIVVVAVLRPGDRGHFPKLLENVSADWNQLIGRTDRESYLGRFGGREQDKWVALEVEHLAAQIRASTAPNDTVYVFGFSPGVLVKSERRSASRFHWSRPVVLEFAAGTPGYGSAGLLADLQQARPAVVALQKQDWGGLNPAASSEPNSNVFFHGNAGLETWLTSGYRFERETPLYEVWRRK